MRNRIFKYLSLVVVSVVLCACSTIKKHWENNPTNYKRNTVSAAPLDVPRAYGKEKIRGYYPVPAVPKANKSASEPVSRLIVPPGVKA